MARDESTIDAIERLRIEGLRRRLDLQRAHDSGKRWCVTHYEYVKKDRDCCTWAECGHRPVCDVRPLLIGEREMD